MLKSVTRFSFWILASVLFAGVASLAEAAGFKVGFATRDITPSAPVPMWGYGGMGPRMSNGVLDSLNAPVVVIESGGKKLALMGIDIGRGPRTTSMDFIRKEVKEKAGVDYVIISGSHTHHGPVTELTDVEGKGRGKYDDAVAYAIELEKKLAEAIIEAAGNAREAKIGVGEAHVPLCRNRHTKFQPKPVDDELSVIRFDDAATGKPIALVANFSAHSTILNAITRKFSAEWPGKMKKYVQEASGAPCIFLQGSAGDLSPNTTEITGKMVQASRAKDQEAIKAGTAAPDVASKLPEVYEIEAFGQQMANEVLKLAQTISTDVPTTPSIQGVDEVFDFETRIKFNDPKIMATYSVAFFKELANNFSDEIGDNRIRPQMTTVLLNGNLAFVGGSGEFFSNHAVRLKQRTRVKTLFVGYCNGHHMYFPTIEAAHEGGYGGDPLVSWVPVGAGEQMMNKALINLYNMRGGFKTEVKVN